LLYTKTYITNQLVNLT